MNNRKLPMVMKMDYRVRVQSISEPVQLVGLSDQRYHEIQNEIRHYTVSIMGIAEELALIVGNKMQQIGGWASLITQEQKTLILSGHFQQFRMLSEHLSSLDSNLIDFSSYLMNRIKNRIENPEGIELHGHRFDWGQRTYIMGIINITPDSFSGDGLAKNSDPNERISFALTQAQYFNEEGADILDIGGESTRPGGESVGIEEELERVIPIIRNLAQNSPLPISVDTQKSKVAEAAMKAGALIINDIWGLQGDPDMARVAADYGAVVVVMHNNQCPVYQDLISDILCFLETSIEQADRFGIPRNHIWVDPGIGFGKTREQNLEILNRLEEFRVLGQPLLLGTSRKSVIGLTLNLPVEERLEGTAATVALGAAKGADILRVHDVRAMTRTARMTDAIMRRA